jgi:hypothetical protein
VVRVSHKVESCTSGITSPFLYVVTFKLHLSQICVPIVTGDSTQFKHNVVCDNNHQITATWNNWSKGKRCRLCYETNKFNNAVKYKNGWDRYEFLTWYYTEKSYKTHYNEINPNNLKTVNSKQYTSTTEHP